MEKTKKVLLLALSVLTMVTATQVVNAQGTQTGWDISTLNVFRLPSGTISGIIGNILSWLLGILGIIGVLGFVISGIIYLISAGDEKMVEKAKAAMKWSIVGVIVGLMGLVVIKAVYAILNQTPMF